MRVLKVEVVKLPATTAMHFGANFVLGGFVFINAHKLKLSMHCFILLLGRGARLRGTQWRDETWPCETCTSARLAFPELMCRCHTCIQRHSTALASKRQRQGRS